MEQSDADAFTQMDAKMKSIHRKCRSKKSRERKAERYFIKDVSIQMSLEEFKLAFNFRCLGLKSVTNFSRFSTDSSRSCTVNNLINQARWSFGLYNHHAAHATSYRAGRNTS